VDNGRDTSKVSILIEHRTDARIRWWTTLEGHIPQEPGDPVLFTRRGAME
jgi:hypothetical protein